MEIFQTRAMLIINPIQLFFYNANRNTMYFQNIATAHVRWYDPCI